MQICLLAEGFVRSLKSLKQTTAPTPQSGTESSAENTQPPQPLLQSVLQLQTQFQKLLAITTADDMNPEIEARVRPLQTEAYRRLRLLTMEVTRLQTAKQPATVEKSRSQINDHLNALLQFAQGIADEVCD